jgi:hypothetical protein
MRPTGGTQEINYPLTPQCARLQRAFTGDQTPLILLWFLERGLSHSGPMRGRIPLIEKPILQPALEWARGSAQITSRCHFLPLPRKPRAGAINNLSTQLPTNPRVSGVQKPKVRTGQRFLCCEHVTIEPFQARDLKRQLTAIHGAPAMSDEKRPQKKPGAETRFSSPQ